MKLSPQNPTTGRPISTWMNKMACPAKKCFSDTLKMF